MRWSRDHSSKSPATWTSVAEYGLCVMSNIYVLVKSFIVVIMFVIVFVIIISYILLYVPCDSDGVHVDYGVFLRERIWL